MSLSVQKWERSKVVCMAKSLIIKSSKSRCEEKKAVPKNALAANVSA